MKKSYGKEEKEERKGRLPFMIFIVKNKPSDGILL